MSPTYAAGFLVGQFGTAYFALAAVVLAVTGTKAWYADMGHFGRRAITRCCRPASGRSRCGTLALSTVLWVVFRRKDWL